MRLSLVLLLLVGCAGSDLSAEGLNQLSESEKKSGWKLLFDGKTTDGWRNFKKDDVSDGWQVVDGALTRVKNGAGDIITKEKYESFDLSIEFKISKGGNSGIMFHVTEEESTPWRTGPEIQIQDNVDGHDPQKAGWVYQLYPASVDATKPAGEWNHLHFRQTPQGSEINMNGIRYSRFTKGSADWDKKVAASKFAAFPKFGKAKTGYLCLQDHGDKVAYRNIKIRVLEPGKDVPDPSDGTLPVKTERAFTKLKWADWEPVDDDGKIAAFRPIVLTHAGDGSNRVFVATQRGVIHVFENDPNVKSSTVFADFSDRVHYFDKQNEEGLLGFAFHPNYKKNGEFFLYYTSEKEPQTSIISRFKVSKEDPNKADPASEEEIMRLKQPFWNHNGGTLCFGPDGYLYIGLGDGGSANDPHGNGQNLGTLLGSILRIDIDHKADGKNYAIPKDNPFVNKEGARPEIYAYGLRNVWRISFDRETGTLWCGDVGQNLWEEINIITKGGNYGWNLREAAHTFGPHGSDAREDLIDPIWEYDHEVGKSITGGVVYRGKKVPELVGAYLYADYVTGKIWALRYDEKAKKVVSNYIIPTPKMPVISFGEDEQGEVYFMIVSPKGEGIYRFTSASTAASNPPLKWEVSEGFVKPESAYLDKESGYLFVSNVDGGGADKDGKGFISKMKPDGTMIKADWITGLNAPKGLRSFGDTLWVSDIDRVVGMSIEKGKVIHEIPVPDAKFLNDVAVGGDGTVYVADMTASRIFQIKDGKVSILDEGPQLESPNGLLVDGNRLILAAWGYTTDFTVKVPGRLLSLDLSTKDVTPITKEPTGNLDGVEADGKGGYYVSDWVAGKVFHIGANGETKVVIELTKSTADIAYLADQQLLILPWMLENKLLAYEVRP